MKAIDGHIQVIALFLSLLLTAPAVVRSSAPPDADILRFADHLYAERDFYRAITEYKRWLFLHPDSTNVPRIRLKIAQAYLEAGKTDAARLHLKELKEEYRGQPEGGAALLLLAGAYHAEARYLDAARELADYLAEYPDASATDQARLLRAMCLWQAGETDRARSELERIPADSLARSQADRLLAAMPRYRNLPLKSPVLAGVLSAALPGAGQVYVGYYSDAAISFLLNGLLIWAAWEAFDNDEYVTGGLLSAVELGWYVGNVYNAVNDAHKFNRRLKRRFFRDLRLKIAPLPGGDPAPAGAALGFSLNF